MNIFKRQKITEVSTNLDTLKKNASDWIIALDTRYYQLQRRLDEQERRIRILEILRRQDNGR